MAQHTQKYRVDTDKGSYEVEVEVPDEPMQSSLGLMADANANTRNGPISDAPEKPSFLTWAANKLSQNPMVKSAAHPTSVGDFLSLILPNQAGLKLAPKIPQALETGGRGAERLGKALSGPSLPVALAEGIKTGSLTKASVVAGGPLALQGTGKVMQGVGGWLRRNPSGIQIDAGPAAEAVSSVPRQMPSLTPVVAPNTPRVMPSLVDSSAAEGVADAGNTASKAALGNSAADASGVAGDLRRQYGARDAAKMLGEELKKRGWADEDIAKLGISPDKIRELAPGPSRTPLVAEQRILDAINKAKQ